MSTEPFLLPTDAEEREELAAAGFLTVDLGDDAAAVSLSGDDLASIGAAASFYLRRMARLTEQKCLVEDVRAREREIVDAVYAGQLSTIDYKLGELRRNVEQLVRAADRLGAFVKRKTMAVAGGVFGKKAIPERVTIADPAVALEWAEEGAPSAVLVTVRVPLDRAREVFTDAEFELYERKREVLISTLADVKGVALEKIPGVSRVGGGEELIVRPEITS